MPPENESLINGQSIPGKIPRVASSRLAIKAAGEIECQTGRPADVKAVMAKLKEWATNRSEDALTESLPGLAVKWQTTKGKSKVFDLDTCGKALERWHKSRR